MFVLLAFGNCKYAIPRKAASGVGFKPGEKNACAYCVEALSGRGVIPKTLAGSGISSFLKTSCT